jgi:hypothetical protein
MPTRFNVLFRLVDRFTLNVLKHYRQLAESQWFSHDRLVDLQFRKLQDLAENFGLEVGSWKDFYGLPFTTKDQLRGYAPKGDYGFSQTSGSTGDPFRFAVPLNHRSVSIATELRNWEWLKWEGQFSFRLTVGEPSKKFKMYAKMLGMACKNYRTVNSDYLRFMRKKPFIVEGGGSAIRELTWLSRKEGIRSKDTIAIIIGEDASRHTPSLSEDYVDIHQSYGLSECVNIASECEYHSLHVNMENCIVEEQQGEIVVTNLNNGVTPFVRYRTGDGGRVEKSSCKCGRKFDIVKEIRGKIVDFYAGDEVKRPLGRWLLSPLTHTYFHYFKTYKAKAYPSEGVFRLFVVPRTTKERAREGLSSYLRWVEEETGFKAETVVVDDLPMDHKLFEVCA